MDKKRPLLSICIPTYNRASILRKSLSAYVENEAFDDEVEIIISDNASTDDTLDVVSDFTSKYPNIRYSRNSENLKDSNFCIVLDKASGEYLKLMNDNFIIDKNGLDCLKSSIKESINSKCPLFFTNGYIFNHKKEDLVKCKDFDEFIKFTSFYVTALGMFGVWREDWANIKERLKYTRLQLNQDDWAYQIVEKKGQSIINTVNYGHIIDVGVRKGYNWFQVHVDYYYTILQPYVDKGLVSKDTLKKEHKTCLKGISIHILAYYYKPILPNHQFDRSGMYKYLFRHFKKDGYFYILMLTFPIWGARIIINSLKSKIIKK